MFGFLVLRFRILIVVVDNGLETYFLLGFIADVGVVFRSFFEFERSDFLVFIIYLDLNRVFFFV